MEQWKIFEQSMDDLKAMSVFTEVAVCLQIETCQVFIPKPSKKKKKSFTSINTEGL